MRPPDRLSQFAAAAFPGRFNYAFNPDRTLGRTFQRNGKRTRDIRVEVRVRSADSARTRASARAR